MWPNWTSDRTPRTRPLRVPAGGRTVDRRSDATHSDGGSTALLPGPAPDLDQDQALVLLQDLLVLRFSGVWGQVQSHCCVLVFPTNSVEQDLRSDTERPRPSCDSHVLSDSSTVSLIRKRTVGNGSAPSQPIRAQRDSPVAAPHKCFPTATSGSWWRRSRGTLPANITESLQTQTPNLDHQTFTDASYLNPDVRCPPAAAQMRRQHPDVSRPPGPEQTRMNSQTGILCLT